MKHQGSLLLFLLLFIEVNTISAQVLNTGMVEQMDSSETGKVIFSGLVDAYYRFDFNEPKEGNVPYFVSSARHNEININLAYLGIHYKNDRVRMRFYPGFGTYINSNYSSETGSLRNLLEANAGICLSKRKAIWLDAGILGSPYTNESAVSKDHFMYTRSLAPEYVPYYLSGIKFSMPLGAKINVYAYLLNGWQNIKETNNGKALGTQLEYRPNNKWLINLNTYIGDETSSNTANVSNRYFADAYCIYNPDGTFSMTACSYFGHQTFADAKTKAANWWQANWIGRLRLKNNHFVAFRAEYFNDTSGVVIRNITTDPSFSAGSMGICYSYRVQQNGMLRIEYRHFYGFNNTFITSSGNSHQSYNITANLSAWF
jgi:hypothetical protein